MKDLHTGRRSSLYWLLFLPWLTSWHSIRVAENLKTVNEKEGRIMLLLIPYTSEVKSVWRWFECMHWFCKSSWLLPPFPQPANSLLLEHWVDQVSSVLPHLHPMARILSFLFFMHGSRPCSQSESVRWAVMIPWRLLQVLNDAEILNVVWDLSLSLPCFVGKLEPTGSLQRVVGMRGGPSNYLSILTNGPSGCPRTCPKCLVSLCPPLSLSVSHSLLADSQPF